MKTKFGEDAKKTAEWFDSVGIPGTKYFDQGSRAGGDGTRNWVVWDQKLLDRMKIE
jgi:hypothetical protein